MVILPYGNRKIPLDVPFLGFGKCFVPPASNPSQLPRNFARIVGMRLRRLCLIFLRDLPRSLIRRYIAQFVGHIILRQRHRFAGHVVILFHRRKRILKL